MTNPSIGITRRARPGAPVSGRRAAAGACTTGRAPSRCAPCPLRGTRLAERVPARIDPWLGAGRQARPGTAPDRLDVAGGVEGGCLRSRAAGWRLSSSPRSSARPPRAAACRQVGGGRT